MSISELLRTKFLGLYQANESGWVFASRTHGRGTQKPPTELNLINDDATVMAPIIEKNGKPHIVLGLHQRPALTNKFGQGLHIEASGGLNMD